MKRWADFMSVKVQLIKLIFAISNFNKSILINKIKLKIAGQNYYFFFQLVFLLSSSMSIECQIAVELQLDWRRTFGQWSTQCGGKCSIFQLY